MVAGEEIYGALCQGGGGLPGPLFQFVTSPDRFGLCVGLWAATLCCKTLGGLWFLTVGFMDKESFCNG